MQNILFIMTHEGSGWEKLVEKLKEDQRFDFFKTDFYYHHPDDLEILTNNQHRRDNAAAVWSDVILHNKDFTCRALRDSCKFVYWQGPIKIPLDQYSYRVQGMRWYHQKTGGLWLQYFNGIPSEGDSLLTAILGGEHDIIA